MAVKVEVSEDGTQLTFKTNDVPVLTVTVAGAQIQTSSGLKTLGSMATQNYTVSTGDPSGGVNGDVWYKV